MHVEILERRLAHDRRGSRRHTGRALGRQQQQRLHLAPRRVVADGKGGRNEDASVSGNGNSWS